MSGPPPRDDSPYLAGADAAPQDYHLTPASGDRESFHRLVDVLRVQLAHATQTPIQELRPHAAESLAVLRLAGALIRPALLAATEDPTATDLAALIGGPVTELVRTASEAVPASILWGDVASVIETSARLIAADHPTRSERAYAVASGTLNLSSLAGAWTGRVGATFRRTSCCQVTGPDPAERRCADCVRGST